MDQNPNPNPLGEILARLDRIERQNRRLRRALRVGLVVVFAAAALGAMKAPRESFTIQDHNGFTRITLDANEKSASIRVLDTDGTTRMFLGTDKTGEPTFTVQDKTGKVVRRFLD